MQIQVPNIYRQTLIAWLKLCRFKTANSDPSDNGYPLIPVDPIFVAKERDLLRLEQKVHFRGTFQSIMDALQNELEQYGMHFPDNLSEMVFHDDPLLDFIHDEHFLPLRDHYEEILFRIAREVHACYCYQISLRYEKLKPEQYVFVPFELAGTDHAQACLTVIQPIFAAMGIVYEPELIKQLYRRQVVEFIREQKLDCYTALTTRLYDDIQFYNQISPNCLTSLTHDSAKLLADYAVAKTSILAARFSIQRERGIE